MNKPETARPLPALGVFGACRARRLKLVYALASMYGWRPRPIAGLARLPKSTVESDLKMLHRLLHPPEDVP